MLSLTKRSSAFLTAAICLLLVHCGIAAEKVAARSTKNDSNSPARDTLLSTTIAEIQVPQAEFKANVSDRTGRDPFFPKADYWQPKDGVKEQLSKPEPDQGQAILSLLKLTGVGGFAERRWAMINGVSVYVGENAVVRVGGKAYEIVFHEMTEKSVVLGLKGSNARREIPID